MIKSFKLFEAEVEDYSVYFKDKINYELLQDLKDLSMDLIDVGYRLLVNIMTVPIYTPICVLNYDHQIYNLYWYKIGDEYYNILNGFNKSGLHYLVSFTKMFNGDEKVTSLDSKEEIISIIKEMYPNERIY